MTDTTAGHGSSLLERRFRFTERGTTLWRDTVAGATTFVVMSYIIFVNPQILTFAGVEVPPGTDTLPFDGVLAVTCLVAGVMTIAMGLYTNYAYAIAPGLGINATIAFSLVVGEGLSYPAAMGLVVIEGLAVTAFVLTGLREKVMEAIPLDLKKAIAMGSASSSRSSASRAPASSSKACRSSTSRLSRPGRSSSPSSGSSSRSRCAHAESAATP
jgi:AGZA family xanthine/uracil permease-like MFS transporter